MRLRLSPAGCVVEEQCCRSGLPGEAEEAEDIDAEAGVVAADPVEPGAAAATAAAVAAEGSGTCCCNRRS